MSGGLLFYQTQRNNKNVIPVIINQTSKLRWPSDNIFAHQTSDVES